MRIMPFLAWRQNPDPLLDPPDPPELAMAVKTLSVSAAITQNPAAAPSPQAIIAAVSSALSDPAFGTASPWTAVITVTAS
jgi:hypothetical protein